MWQAKLEAMAGAIPFIVVGVGIFKFGRPLTVYSNKVYARLPGSFQYPAWYHRLFGATVCAFGLIIVAVALAFVK